MNPIIGSVLRDMRTDAGMSCEAVAAQLGCTPSVISGWERGERTIFVHRLADLCKVYGVSLPTALMAIEHRLNRKKAS